MGVQDRRLGGDRWRGPRVGREPHPSGHGRTCRSRGDRKGGCREPDLGPGPPGADRGLHPDARRPHRDPRLDQRWPSLAGALARFGMSAAIIGTAGAVILLSLDGFAAKHLAESWLSAPADARATALAAFSAEDSINFALLSPLNLVFAGVTFVLYGLAAAFSSVYPRWLGWVAVAGGAGGAVSGVIQASIGEPSSITQALGIAAPTIITLWLLVVGILLVRMGMGHTHTDVLVRS